MRPFSKCTAVRTPFTSRFRRISLAHSPEDCAPPAVSDMEGSCRLSNIASRNEFRNCSFTVIVDSGAAVRRLREMPASWAVTVAKQNNTGRKTIKDFAFILMNPHLECAGKAQRRRRSGIASIAKKLIQSGVAAPLCHRTPKLQATANNVVEANQADAFFFVVNHRQHVDL